MLYLILAILTYTVLFASFKFFDKYKVNATFAITLNYLVAMVAGIFYRNFDLSVSGIVYAGWFPMAAIVGFLFFFGFLLIAISMRKVGVALTVVSGKMSVLISVVAGFILLNEPFTWWKMFGIVIALIAFYLTFRNTQGEKINKYFIFLPFLIFLGNGIGDTLMKLSGVRFPERNEVDFLITVFTVAFLFGFATLCYQIIFNRIKFSWKDVIAGVWLGLVNWIATYTFLMALVDFPLSIFFPVFNASVVTLVALIGYFFFSEKLKLINWAGIGLAIVAIIVISAS